MPRLSKSTDDEPDSSVSGSRRTSAKAYRFQDALGLNRHPKAFNDIKAHVRRLSDQHFDYSFSASQQSEKSWKDFESQVCAMYPIFLKDPQAKALLHLKVYIKKHIGRMAWQHRKGNVRKGDNQNDPDSDFSMTYDVTQNTANLKSLRPVRAATNRSPLANIHQHYEENTTSSQSSSSQGSSHSGTEVESKRSSERKVTISPQPGSADPISRIKKFLGSCQPSMLHLLPSLTRLGFINDEALDGILAWPVSELLSVLEKWKHAGHLTALELEALRMGFAQSRVEK